MVENAVAAEGYGVVRTKCASQLMQVIKLPGSVYFWWCLPVLLFSKSNYIFFGYFDPKHVFLDNEND